MAYRRRPKRKSNQGAGRVIVVVVILGLGLYLALGTAVGNWVADNVFKPLFTRKEDDNPPADTSEPEVTPYVADSGLSFSVGDGADASPASTQQDNTVEEVTVESISAFALQLGAFSTRENAEAFALTMKERGAGGYVYEADGHYRVLAACYNSQSDAKKVKEKLMSDNGVDSTIYTIEADGVELRVTAGQEKLSAVKSAFSLLKSTCDELYRLSTGLDKSEITEQQVREELSTLTGKLEGPLDALNGQGDAVSLLTDALRTAKTELEGLHESGNTGTLFAAELKCVQLGRVCAYAELLKTLSGAGAA